MSTKVENDMESEIALGLKGVPPYLFQEHQRLGVAGCVQRKCFGPVRALNPNPLPVPGLAGRSTTEGLPVWA